MCKTQKKKTFHFITLSQEQLKVQYIFEERHRSMKENCLWGRCRKKVKKPNNSAFSATYTYIKLTLVTFFLLFFLCTFLLDSDALSSNLNCEIICTNFEQYLPYRRMLFFAEGSISISLPLGTIRISLHTLLSATDQD